MAHDPHAAHASADDEYLNPASGSGHEHTDANVSMIVQFAVWLAASAIIVHILMWFTFAFFVDLRENKGDGGVPARHRAGSAAAGGPATPAEAGERDLRLPPARERRSRRLQLGRQGRGHGADPDLRGDAPDGRARTAVARRGRGRCADRDASALVPTDASAGRPGGKKKAIRQ